MLHISQFSIFCGIQFSRSLVARAPLKFTSTDICDFAANSRVLKDAPTPMSPASLRLLSTLITVVAVCVDDKETALTTHAGSLEENVSLNPDYPEPVPSFLLPDFVPALRSFVVGGFDSLRKAPLLLPMRPSSTFNPAPETPEVRALTQETPALW